MAKVDCAKIFVEAAVVAAAPAVVDEFDVNVHCSPRPKSGRSHVPASPSALVRVICPFASTFRLAESQRP